MSFKKPLQITENNLNKQPLNGEMLTAIFFNCQMGADIFDTKQFSPMRNLILGGYIVSFYGKISGFYWFIYLKYIVKSGKCIVKSGKGKSGSVLCVFL